jgi:hypothetical protein
VDLLRFSPQKVVLVPGKEDGVSEVFKCKALRLRVRECTKVHDRVRASKATLQLGASETAWLFSGKTSLAF